MKAIGKIISVFLIISFLSLSFPLQVLSKELPEPIQKETKSKTLVKKEESKKEPIEFFKLQKAFLKALERIEKLLEAVKKADKDAITKIQEKLEALKGIRKAYLYQFDSSEKNIDKYFKKKLLSLEKKRKFEETKKKFFESFDKLLASLSQIDSSKPFSENAAFAFQSTIEIQAITSEEEKGVPPLPDPKKFKLPHRIEKAKDIEDKELQELQRILKEENLEEDDPSGSKPLTPSPPTPEDLTSTIDVQITPEIIAKANELGKDPNKIFRFVHDTIFYEPYWGSQKGSLETLFDRAGNDIDQASLLIALLKASGIPARHEWGGAQIRIRPLLNWLGVKDSQTAIDILRRNGISSVPIIRGGKIGGALFVHFWVIAYIDGKWWRLDPSFKQYEDIEPTDIARIIGFDLNKFESIALENAIIDPTFVTFTNINFIGIESYTEESASKLEAAFPTPQNFLGERKIEPQKGKGLPHHLPLRIRYFRTVFPDFFETWNLRFKVRFQLDGIDVTFRIPEITNKRLSIEYVPSTPEDARIIQEAGGIYNVIPAYIVNMKPVMKLEDKIIGEGSSAPLGSFQILRSTFEEPKFFPDINEKYLLVGEEYSIGIGIERTTLNEALEKRINDLRSLRTQGPPPEEKIKEVLWLKAMTYFIFYDQSSEALARFRNVVWTRLPIEAITAKDIVSFWLFGFPYQVKPGGYSIDVRRNVVLPFSKSGIKDEVIGWMIGSGSIGSGQEHLINEEIHNVASVSTIKILELSSNQSVPIHIIYKDNLNKTLPVLEIRQSLKDSIASFINMGFIVIIPRKLTQLNEWTGTGYMVLDPDTGSGGYFISGAVGKEIKINGGATSFSQVDPWTSQAMDPSKEAQKKRAHRLSIIYNLIAAIIIVVEYAVLKYVPIFALKVLAIVLSIFIVPVFYTVALIKMREAKDP